uniref:LysM and putative peptidoglycan-binding domain-containing protein 2 n=1 Tax=Anthurium amnicola TaxID=1678845 RepID=A0A1D1Y6S4_9ARAE
MQIGMSRRNVSSFQLLSDGLVDRAVTGEADGFTPSSASASIRLTPCANYIEHRVSKMDTLAGVAIKYGVEVADIKRMNALVTDHQMFGHRSIKIPLPGRHLPSPITSNGLASNGDQSPRWLLQRDLFESFQSLKLKSPQRTVSPAMNSLQGYYGLTTPKRSPIAEGTEMVVYRTGRVPCLEDEPLPRVSPISYLYPNCHHKSRSPVNVFSMENGNSAQDVAIVEATENGETDRSSSENSVRRRQRIDVDWLCRAPDLLPKQDAGACSGRTGKGLALRPKCGSRTDLDSSYTSTISTGDSIIVNGFLPVRKSSSTSNLQESDNNSSIWLTSKWSLKPDVIAKPLFDGLPKPMAVRRNKAALD